jgi:hypothetical protein
MMYDLVIMSNVLRVIDADKTILKNVILALRLM